MKKLVKADGWYWLLLPLMVGALYLDFVWSPDDRILGASQRIFYFHMGAAAVVLLAFSITAVASVTYLLTRMFKMLQKTRQLARDIALLADEEGKQDLPVADAPSVAPHVRSREL
ncbi:hypothetical protein [Sulfobacillus thermotolerans]|uniref:hypothetical protein n=1 Tax=Sulfobacillus thermotolerans TaxID=338644 RepID=UPI0033666D82